MCRPAVQQVLRLAAALALACGHGSSSSASPPPAIDVSQEWVEASPASQNIDATLLASAYSTALAASPGLQALVVIRNGKLVAEQYFDGTNAGTLHDGRSATKSVTSLLVGAAISKGVLAGATESLTTLIHPPVAQVPSAETNITIDNLLTMTAGFQWDEDGAIGYNDWILAPNQVDYLLSKPIADAPGTYFAYNSAGVHLLSVGIAEATNHPTQTYADDNLFVPLGITQRAWEQDAQGYQNGAAGLSLCARDWSRIGQLVLQKGLSGTTQVIPADWIAKATAVHWTPDGQIGSINHLQYGYLFWLGSTGGHAVQFAWGYRGQFVFIVPDLQLVVTAMSRLGDASLDPDVEENATMSLIVNGVLPAVH